MRTDADAPTVEESVARERASGDRRREPQVQNLLALDEERPSLLEERLEGGEIDLRGVGLDLAEIGVEGKVEGQVVGDSDLAVEADVEVVVATRAKRVALLARSALAASHSVGQELDATLGLEVLQALQLSELADPARRVLGNALPGRAFLKAVELAHHLQAPGLV